MPLSLCSLALAAVLSACGGSDGPEKSIVAVIGDVPYGTTPTDTTQLVGGPKFVSAINADADISTVMHVGDIHSGKSYCTQAYNQTVFDQWKAFRMPLVYAIGDNEWADCHKKAEGGGVYNAATGAIDYVVDANGTPVAGLQNFQQQLIVQPVNPDDLTVYVGPDPDGLLLTAAVSRNGQPLTQISWLRSR